MPEATAGQCRLETGLVLLTTRSMGFLDPTLLRTSWLHSRLPQAALQKSEYQATWWGSEVAEVNAQKRKRESVDEGNNWSRKISSLGLQCSNTLLYVGLGKHNPVQSRALCEQVQDTVRVRNIVKVEWGTPAFPNQNFLTYQYSLCFLFFCQNFVSDSSFTPSCVVWRKGYMAFT